MNIAECRCGGKTKVYVTKPLTINGIATFKRGRECTKCGSRWPTVEVPLDLARDVLEED